MDNRVAVIIVNYGTAALVCQSLRSLNEERQYLPNLETVVVDNCSPDDSFSILSQFVTENDLGHWVQLVKAEKNGGYAYGNNVGFDKIHERGPADYYWLLNPDTFLRPQAGLKLVEFLAQNPHAIAGSRLEDEDGTAQVSTFNFPGAVSETLNGFGIGFLDRIFHRKRVTRDISHSQEKVDWVAGASLMLPRKVMESVGPMDDHYFLYFEEVDYCLKIQKAGFQCWYLPASRVVHIVGASTGISDVRKTQPRRPQYWFDSRTRYFSKNFSRVQWALADLGWIIGYLSWRIRKYCVFSQDLKTQPPHLLTDFWRNSVLNPFK